MLMFVVTAVPVAARQQTPRERLQNTYEGVQFHELRERVRTVYGARMSVGKSPREAAQAWLAVYGDVFANGPLDVEQFRVMPRTKHDGTVLMYRQRMDDLPVLGSSLRVMTFGEDPSHVVYVAARVAIRPKGGLPQPKVTGRQAVEAAGKHPEAEGLTNWSEPDLVAIYDDPPAGTAVAYPVWRCIGTRVDPYDAKTFYVHAVDGHVARHHSNIMSAADITGTVTGKATPADTNSNPEELGPDTFVLTSEECPNDPDTFSIRDLLIRAFQGTTLIDSVFSGSGGTYTLDVANSTTVDVHASLIGPGWEVLDGSSEPWGEPISPMIASNITAPASGVNFSFNPSPTEAGTAFMNAHVSMARTWEYIGAYDFDFFPSVPVVVHSEEDVCNAHFILPTDNDQPPWPGVTRFYQSTETPDCPNSAYSTIVAHEYGHFVAYHLLGVQEYDFLTSTFHEGFADALAHLTFDTIVYGQDNYGCGLHVRTPYDPFPPIKIEYPICWHHPPHVRGMLLSALWLDIRNELGFSNTQTLYRGWILLAQVPAMASGLCGLTPPVGMPQAADEGTLIEILTADSPDGNPANAVNLAEICEIFDERRITTLVCPESVGRSRYADCDRSGTLDILDFLCFQNEFAAGGIYADCDRDGRFTPLDFMCFQNAFVRGIR